MEYGPQISSSGVTDMLSNGGLTHLHSLSFLFTPISPKALHQLSCEWLVRLIDEMQVQQKLKKTKRAVDLKV